MYFHALAFDYDGTLAHDGVVAQETVEKLLLLKESGRKLLLVTGRRLDDLLTIFPQAASFDRIVAENGALLYDPHTKEEWLLATPPDQAFIDALKRHGVEAVTGKVIVATWSPHESEVLQTIHELGLEMQVIFNKGAVMVLPSGVNKATGLEAALQSVSLSRHNTIAVGDAENDHAMFSFSEIAVAVANALPGVKQHADVVTEGDHGAGVCELAYTLLTDESVLLKQAAQRHHICVGITAEAVPVTLDSNSGKVLVAGPSGSGKTLFTLAAVEHLAALGYQFCLIDPERDYEELECAVVLGDSKRAPTVQEVVQALKDPDINVVVSLLGVPHDDRPQFLNNLMPSIRQLRKRYGRPHWFIADEAHYLLPHGLQADADALPDERSLLITVHPDHLDHDLLKTVGMLIATPADAKQTVSSFCKAVGEPLPVFTNFRGSDHDLLFWNRREKKLPTAFHALRPHHEHHRHLRKYAEGDLGAYHSFYFTGAAGRLNLKAQNLQMFIQLSSGIDDETWLYHLRRHDYSTWFRGSIRDESLANEVTRVENDFALSAQSSREQIRQSIETRYSAPV